MADGRAARSHYPSLFVVLAEAVFCDVVSRTGRDQVLTAKRAVYPAARLQQVSSAQSQVHYWEVS